MDGIKEQPNVTAGLDLGDKYSYLCLIDTDTGEVIEEGRVRTTPEALRRRFSSEQQPLRVAIEAGTHSPWVSRVLEEYAATRSWWPTLARRDLSTQTSAKPTR